MDKIKSLLGTAYEKLNDSLSDILKINDKLDILFDKFKALDELVKIGIIFLAIIISYLGVFQLVKKVVFGLPKKLFFFAIFLVVLYFVVTFLLK